MINPNEECLFIPYWFLQATSSPPKLNNVSSSSLIMELRETSTPLAAVVATARLFDVVVGGLELVLVVVVGLGVVVGGVHVVVGWVVVGACQVVVGSGVGDGEGAPAPKTHVPYKTPAPMSAKNSNRPSEKSRPA